ncbi:MAG: hypothetical protein GY862_01140 [Gammaproteobacteria bacterium]|nr:hypothetical protein [Gammaproteobacteria bacterium]
MPHSVTLDLPDGFYNPLQRIARAAKQPMQNILLTALQSSLPPLDGLPENLAEELSRLEMLDDNALQQVLLKVVPFDQQQELEMLLQKNQAGTLSGTGIQRLNSLQGMVNKIMLQKARAAVLLRFRGKRLPTLDELRQCI